ncbi:hypothetical protein QFC22_004985 [Naganishia vaughanmartiniae]|uniref:Uncharacterized protein n=1 Tax=Naganishia vaughanmartiniae TaxID=1424756 RepID=A0ACC2WWF6_9TREE|nr:hypothetical protein QFC22_004985 [Naganishia vaughanmartiniae]
MAFHKQIDYLKSCLPSISDELSKDSRDPDETSCWMTRLSVHTHTGGGAYLDSGWKGSILHHDPGERPLLISGAGTDGLSGLTRWSGECAPETIADADGKDCNAEDLAKLYADATHVLACQIVEMVGGKVTHYVRTKAFNSKSIGKLDEWVARQFKNSPTVPPSFAKDMMRMLILSKEYWAKMQKEAELNEDPKCVEMARGHQEALEGLLASPMLQEKGLVMNPLTDRQAHKRRIPDIVIPVSANMQDFFKSLLFGRQV